ncbi:MAG: Gfo/Idh/MocA family protein [Thermoproteota archaeon]
MTPLDTFFGDVQKVYAFVGQFERWPLVNEAKLLGTPRIFYAIHAGWEDPLKPRNWHWRVDKMLSGGGLVMDSGAHFCDSIRYFFWRCSKGLRIRWAV